MSKMKSLALAFTILLTLGTASCARHAPPTLSPAGAVAYNNHRVQNVLDLIRNTAQDGNAQTPPVFSTATARSVTLWHESAIKTIHATGDGWQPALRVGLDQLLERLPAAESARLAPYVTLLKTILAEVTQ